MTKRRTTAANASLISTRSRSSTVRPAFASAFLRGGRGAGEHDRRVGAGDRGGEDPRPRLQAELARRSARCRSPAATRRRRCPDELPGVWTWSIFSTQWYFCSATASKPPISPIAANDGLSLPSVSTVVPGRMNSSWSRTTLLVEVLDRDDASSAKRPSACAVGGALLRARGVGVDVLAAELLDRRDQVGADALRDERRVVVGLGVHRPGAAVGAHRHARHRLDAAGEDEVLPAGGDLLGGDVDGLQARGAEAVELHAGDGVRQAGLDRGGLGDVGALVADRRDAAEHDVVDPLGIEAARCGSSISCIRPTTRSTGLVVCSDPLLLPLPRGVRIASNTNASVAGIAV